MAETVMITTMTAVTTEADSEAAFEAVVAVDGTIATGTMIEVEIGSGLLLEADTVDRTVPRTDQAGGEMLNRTARLGDPLCLKITGIDPRITRQDPPELADRHWMNSGAKSVQARQILPLPLLYPPGLEETIHQLYLPPVVTQLTPDPIIVLLYIMVLLRSPLRVDRPIQLLHKRGWTPST